MLKICHKSDAKRFSKSPARVDPPSRTDPMFAAKTVDQCSVWRWPAESRAIPKIAKTVRKRIVNAAMMLRASVRPPLDRIRHHLDLMTVAMCEIDLSKTKNKQKQEKAREIQSNWSRNNE